MSDELWKQLRNYARNKLYGELDALRSKREKDRSALCKDQLASGFGLILDPLDSRFDEVEVEHFRAELRACLHAWLEAYEVKGVTPDKRIWNELCSFKTATLDARIMSLCQTASARANRTGKNPAPGIARAEALGNELERSSHAFMKLLYCEIEKEMNMKEKLSGRTQVINNFTQIIHGDAANVAIGPSATIHISEYNVFNTIEAEIESRLLDGQEKTQLQEILESLRSSKDKPSFIERIKSLMRIAESCRELAPHISKWAQELHKYAQAHFLI